jgi:hypothetical protein
MIAMRIKADDKNDQEVSMIYRSEPLNDFFG